MRVQLNGSVISDEDQWLYDFFEVPAFSPQRVRAALDATPDGEDLTLEINSGGGSVFAGFEIYSVLQNAEVRTVAEVQSLAASSASVVMLGCDEVHASPVAQVMIHLPSVVTDGDRYAHQDSIGVLDAVTNSILNAYVIKSAGRTTRDDLKRLMKSSTWMTAPEARDLGLIDHIVGEDQIDPKDILNCAGGVTHGIRAMAAGGAPDRATLLARYEALVAEGKAAPHGVIQDPTPQEPDQPKDELELAKAQLELEKIRFLRE